MFWIQLYSGKRTVTGAVTGEMKLIESKILGFSYKTAFEFKVADSPSFAS